MKETKDLEVFGALYDDELIWIDSWYFDEENVENLKGNLSL